MPDRTLKLDDLQSVKLGAFWILKGIVCTLQDIEHAASPMSNACCERLQRLVHPSASGPFEANAMVELLDVLLGTSTALPDSLLEWVDTSGIASNVAHRLKSATHIAGEDRTKDLETESIRQIGHRRQSQLCCPTLSAPAGDQCRACHRLKAWSTFYSTA